jgi:hypothetical protein
MEELRFGVRRIAEGSTHLHPRHGAPGALAWRATHLTGGNERPLERGAPRIPEEIARPRNLGHRQRLYLRRRFRPLERTLRIQDRADRLAGHDAARGETPAVSDSIDLVSDRLIVITSTNEIGTN